jgi:hypothetical protein
MRRHFDWSHKLGPLSRITHLGKLPEKAFPQDLFAPQQQLMVSPMHGKARAAHCCWFASFIYMKI